MIALISGLFQIASTFLGRCADVFVIVAEKFTLDDLTAGVLKLA